MHNRWWIYQRERFPLAAHAPVVLAFSLSAIGYSALLRGATGFPAFKACLVAFLSSLLSFLQLRIADEFKDFEEDSRWRPYRPVPRGLVTLRELGRVWGGCIAAQLALSLWLAPRLVLPLAVTWTYLGLMTREFFARRWLKAHPTIYMISHMAIMPLVDFYATACDWAAQAHPHPPRGLGWFLIVSLFNGMVIEIGRKLRSPQDEEAGVETYSALWGRERAALAWLALMTVTAVFAALAANVIGFMPAVAALLGALVAGCGWLGWRFLRQLAAGGGRRLETASGVWSLLLYLDLGVVPVMVRHWSGL